MERIKKVNVLGTEYTLKELKKEDDLSLENSDGYCDTSSKECIVEIMDETGAGFKKNMHIYKNSVKRHELIHAFLFESGLDSCSWAENEEMIDWFAIQFPKLMKVFEEADCL